MYLTCREDPKIQWFLDSLKREVEGIYVKLIVVDHYRNQRPLPLEGLPFETVWIEPMPNHFSGPHRLTKEDWFSAGASRNSGLCYASDGHIVYVDDLSVLMPGWGNAVRDMMKGKYIVCGAYHKVNKLVVENGKVISYEKGALDHRHSHGSDSGPVSCSGGWLFGCSCGGPVDVFLNVEGWPSSLCDGMGYEDTALGVVLANNGADIRYDRRMMTLEDDGLHGVGKVMIRRDKGVSPNDRSHALNDKTRRLSKFDNYFEGGIRKLRLDTLSGKPFPPSRMPTVDWFDQQNIADFTP